MTPNQAKVLVIVGRNTDRGRKKKALPFSSLEECLPIKFGFLMRAMDGLREMGLLNSKKTNISLTQRGRNVYNAIKEVWDP